MILFLGQAEHPARDGGGCPRSGLGFICIIVAHDDGTHVSMESYEGGEAEFITGTYVRTMSNKRTVLISAHHLRNVNPQAGT